MASDVPTRPRGGQIDGKALSQLLLAPGQLGLDARKRCSIGAPSTPTTLGQYRILDLIAVGGMGAVYRAQQDRTNRIVALKVIRAGLFSPRATRRFEFEAELLARLQHPGIATIHEAGFFDSAEGSQPFFAMQYIDGQPITRLDQRSSLNVRDRLSLIAQVCDAVQHAHQRGVIHRDLKPANILVDSDGQPRVLDFGVARATDADIALTQTATAEGVHGLAGTLAYMSPEQLSVDQHNVDHRVDVYALGVTCFELLTGRLPYQFSSNSLFEAATIIREGQLPKPSSIAAELKGDVETILLKALEKDADRRYQSAADFAADIRRFLNNDPILARPPSSLYRLRKFSQRNKALAGMLVAAAATLLIGMVTTSWQALRATRSEQRATDRLTAMRALASNVLDQLQLAIAQAPQSTPLRASLVKSTTEFLDGMEKDLSDDPVFLRQIGTAHTRLALLMYDIRSPSIGDPEAATRHHDRALAQLNRSITLEPSSIQTRAALASEESSFADFLRSKGEVDSTVQHYKQAVMNFQMVFNQGELIGCVQAISALRQGSDTLVEAHRNAEADAVINSGMAYALQIRWPSEITSSVLRQQGEFQTQLAMLAMSNNRHELALAHFDAAEPLLQKAADMGEDQQAMLGALGDARRSKAFLLEETGHIREALQSAQQAGLCYQKLLQGHPGHQSALTLLGMSQGHQARLYVKLGDARHAIDASLAGALTLQSLCDFDSNSPHFRTQAREGWEDHLERMLELLEHGVADHAMADEALLQAKDAQRHLAELAAMNNDENPSAYLSPRIIQKEEARLSQLRERLKAIEAVRSVDGDDK